MIGQVSLLAIATIVLVAIGCSSGVDAAVPPGQPDSNGNLPVPVPTSTPWPRFGPPTVSAEEVAATELQALSTPTATAVPGGSGRINTSAASDPGQGEPTFVFGSTTPVAVAAPEPAVTPLDSSGTFETVFSYNYLVPDEWRAVVGDDVIVLEDRSGTTRVTLRERSFDRTLATSLSMIAATDEPVQFVDWEERSLSDSRAISDLAHEFEYSGTKYGEPFVAQVRWHLRGDLIIEVVTEAPAGSWATDSRLRNSALLAARSFDPVPDVPTVAISEIEDRLLARFNQRAGNFFIAPDEEIGRIELTCREVFYSLLSSPVYVGAGVWQVFAIGDQGAQVWELFEPSLTIVPAAHNTTNC